MIEVHDHMMRWSAWKLRRPKLIQICWSEHRSELKSYIWSGVAESGNIHQCCVDQRLTKDWQLHQIPFEIFCGTAYIPDLHSVWNIGNLLSKKYGSINPWALHPKLMQRHALVFYLWLMTRVSRHAWVAIAHINKEFFLSKELGRIIMLCSWRAHFSGTM